MRGNQLAIALTLTAVFSPLISNSEIRLAAATISTGIKGEDGILLHEVVSAEQAGKTHIQVLLPDQLQPNGQHSVVYVLPVEAGRERHYGDGLLEIKQQNLHNRHQAIFIAPTFSQLPWYADHPTDPAIRQETYLLKVVLPFVEQTYPVKAESRGRLLLGFSKSGWGAWSLLLRHHEVFGRAAAWDAPLTMDRLGQYGTAPIFETQETFEHYRISDLLRSKGHELGPDRRLILTGYGNFREHHLRTQQLLLDLKIPHVYKDGPQRKHDWHSGWVTEAVNVLLEPPK